MNASRQTAWAGAFWLLVIVGSAGAAAQWAWGVHQAAARQIETIEPRFARLLGMGGDKTRLRDATIEAGRSVERHAYPATRDASQAGNDAQQRVRDLISKAGLEVTSIQVLAARQTPQFDRIPIVMRVEGELALVQSALAALPSLKPSLFVEGFTFQGATVSDNAPARVVAEFQMFALRVRP